MKARIVAATAAAALVATAASLHPATATAAPARPQPRTVTQPDGTTVTLMLRGDEWFHWTTDLDGHLLVPDEAGCYHCATPTQQAAWEAEAATAALRRQEAARRRAARLSAARSRCTDDVPAEDGADDDACTSHFSFPSRGQVRGLVVLVEYQDVRFSIDDPHQLYADMMMKPGFDYTSGKYQHYGSAHDYFYQNSFGQFDPQFDVYGPLTLQHERAYYGHNAGYNDSKPQEMIIEACEQLDALGIDFTQYDANNDGYIDFVFAIYAGQGENANGVSPDAVWPHAWSMSSAGEGGRHKFSGKVLEDYACTCELFGSRLDGVGTFCHEFSHVLGLPDLYDVNYSGEGAYSYSVLDNGCYMRSGYHPIGYGSYERYELGWMQPDTLPTQAATVQLTDLGSTNHACLYVVADPEAPTEPEAEAAAPTDPREGEYYLFENRQLTGWDTYLPGHGLLVWHIDYVDSKWWSNTVNTWIYHQCVDLVEADGIKSQQDGSETFPGLSGHTEFTDDTLPAFSGWTHPGKSGSSLGHRLGLPLTGIREEAAADDAPALLTFDVLGGGAALNAVGHDPAPVSSPRIVLRRGHLTLLTPAGSYDAMGRMVAE